MNEIETLAGLAKTAGYRYAKKAGNQLHVAGQVPVDSCGDIADPYRQAQQCLANLELLLNCHDFGENDIQHLTVYVVGGRDGLTSAWQAVKEAYPEGVPLATLLGVALLGYDNQLVEIDAKVVKEL